MTTYRPQQVNEDGPGRCSVCMAVITKLIERTTSRLLKGEWKGNSWTEHECARKAK